MQQRVPVYRESTDTVILYLLVEITVASVTGFSVGAAVRWDGEIRGTIRRIENGTLSVQMGDDAPPTVGQTITNAAETVNTTALRVVYVDKATTMAEGDFVALEGFDATTSLTAVTFTEDLRFIVQVLDEVTDEAPVGVYYALIGSGETPRLGIPLPSVTDAEPVPIIGAAFERIDELLAENRTRTVHATVPYPGLVGLTPLMLLYPRPWTLRRVTAVVDTGGGDLAVYTGAAGDEELLADFALTDEIASEGDLDEPSAAGGQLWVELTDVSGDPTALHVSIELEENAT
jgi:hypothetical protein